MSRRKLLLADDSVTIQKVVNLTFADEGIDVVAVGDGDSAMQSIVNDLPDIVLADVHMPGVTGYQICEMLRENEATSHIPVILLVGSFEPFDEAEAQRVGASTYLTKPFTSIRQLVAKVTELIAPSASEAETAELQPAVEAQFAETVPDIEPVQADESPAFAEPEPVQFNVPEAGSTMDDIDKLYAASLSPETSEASELADIGVDDDIIETSYSAENGTADITDFEIQSRTVESTSDEFPTVDLPGEVPESIFDSQVSEEAAALSAPSWSSETVNETIGDSEPEPVAFIDEEEIEQPPKTLPYTERELAQEPDFDSQMAASFGEEQEEEPEPVSNVVDFAVVPPTPVAEPETEGSSVGEDTVRMDDRFDNTASADFLFDDIDLLDIPNDVPVEVTSAAAAAKDGKAERLVTLSPELIEMIAQRVVEKMSEKY